ncbi:MAG: transporter substrate-binding domain-containing protein [Hyphomicrobiales bacterium]|nr:transporter substrate-binding domain-containing protein [Rhodoblastus sp.]MCC2111117.1 transporter substrate-binding domain-containing protein [Hyphomicrobiales bacterium]
MLAAILLVLATGAALTPACGQDGGFVPSFWDPARRLTRPDTSAIHLIRFLASDDYPPFDFALPDGALTGFSVDLARAVCEELKVACTVQARRWDTLATALADNKGDALIAGLAITDRTREQFAFTRPYMLLPGRFVARAGQAPAPDATPERMGAAKTGVIAGSAHAAWLEVYFPKLALTRYDGATAQRSALVKGDVDVIFGDGVALAGWLNGSESKACCAFFGGPFIDRAYFGEGLTIAVRKNNAALRAALDYGLARVAERGVYTELYLKYFPVGAF